MQAINRIKSSSEHLREGLYKMIMVSKIKGNQSHTDIMKFILLEGMTA